MNGEFPSISSSPLGQVPTSRPLRRPRNAPTYFRTTPSPDRELRQLDVNSTALPAISSASPPPSTSITQGWTTTSRTIQAHIPRNESTGILKVENLEDLEDLEGKSTAPQSPPRVGTSMSNSTEENENGSFRRSPQKRLSAQEIRSIANSTPISDLNLVSKSPTYIAGTLRQTLYPKLNGPVSQACENTVTNPEIARQRPTLPPTVRTPSLPPTDNATPSPHDRITALLMKPLPKKGVVLNPIDPK